MRISPSHTNQGYEGTCRLHATAKCFINNVVCKIQPKKFEFNPSCNRFLTTEEPQFKGLSEEQCNSSGYFKIIWFWMIFEALRRVKNYDEDTKPGNVDYIMSKLDSSFKRSSRIPFEHQQIGRGMFEKFRKCVESYDVIYYHFPGSFDSEKDYYQLPSVTKRIFSFCLRHKLYIHLTLKTIEDERHAVVLVAEDTTHYYIKNTWKDTVTKVSKTEMFEMFDMEGEKFAGTYFSVYLTYKKGHGLKTAALVGYQFVDENMFLIMDCKKWLDGHKNYKLPHVCVDRVLRTRKDRK